MKYTKEAFIYEAENVWVTIDSNIRTDGHSIDFLNTNRLTFAAIPMEIAILELK